ncbi:hypothetical protein RFI_27842 [Reticulomyxa filosa]|uniref:Actin n=1 Tax=Reticulomyxa filosa TaxID=46433 RepID=X6M6K0_RETFI|nr:hypothetical protein RFI_27842 [Reticulomyxa filosa]|eukprot:ETO09534.1 hypothetical protein RFI_27842 [Reticulomyxa filosa]
MDEKNREHVIIDNGSGTTKAGFSGELVPQIVFPTVIGKPKHTGITFETIQKDVCFGSDAQNKEDLLNLTYPIERTLVMNWDHMEKIWHHIFHNELYIQPDEHRVLLTEAPLTPKARREKVPEIMFEKFHVLGMYLGLQPMLSLFGNGMITGLVFEAGDGMAQSTPVYEGTAYEVAVSRLNLAGCDLTDSLLKMLREKGYSLTTNLERETIRDIKEKFTYVAEDYQSELKKAETSTDIERNYELPDGQIITIGSERFQCPEALFSATSNGYNKGIHTILYESIMKCDIDFRSTFYKSIVLAGGSTMFPNTDVRLTKEIAKLVSGTMTIKVIASPQRKYSSWIGGSILCNLESFQDMWVTQHEYDDSGPSIVHRRC